MAVTGNVFEHNGRTAAAHVPSQPLWTVIIKGFILLLAIITLALSAYAISYWGGGYGGFGLNIFTSLLTFIAFTYIFLTAFKFTNAYNMWAQLGLEIALVIFWLSTFAAIAAVAAAFDYYDGSSYYYYGYKRDVSTHDLSKRISYSSNGETAVACVKAAAALGAFAWVLSIISLVFFSISLHRHRIAGNPETPSGLGGAPAVTQEHKMEPVVGEQQVNPSYDAQPGTGAAPYPNTTPYPQAYAQQPAHVQQPAYGQQQV